MRGEVSAWLGRDDPRRAVARARAAMAGMDPLLASATYRLAGVVPVLRTAATMVRDDRAIEAEEVVDDLMILGLVDPDRHGGWITGIKSAAAAAAGRQASAVDLTLDPYDALAEQLEIRARSMPAAFAGVADELRIQASSAAEIPAQSSLVG